MTDPYVTPKESPDDRIDHGVVRQGQPCPECGSTSTGADSLHIRPSILATLLFGWIFLLIRTAFGKKTVSCQDCGASWSFRSVGNNLALAALLFIVLALALGYFADPVD